MKKYCFLFAILLCLGTVWVTSWCLSIVDALRPVDYRGLLYAQYVLRDAGDYVRAQTANGALQKEYGWVCDDANINEPPIVYALQSDGGYMITQQLHGRQYLNYFISLDPNSPSRWIFEPDDSGEKEIPLHFVQKDGRTIVENFKDVEPYLTKR